VTELIAGDEEHRAGGGEEIGSRWSGSSGHAGMVLTR
jgi:hypothetical protein